MSRSVVIVVASTAVAIGAAVAARRWWRRPDGLGSALALAALRLGARGIRAILPLAWRMRIVAALAERQVPGQTTVGVELLRDFAHDDPVAFHQFLWANHLAYASSYGVERFVSGSLEKDHRLIFARIAEELRHQGIDPASDVSSVLDVGCSSGFLLRAAETSEFPSADLLVGIDIDQRAIEIGRAHLRKAGSRIELIEARMEELETVLDGRRFDVSLCCGAVSYLDEERATQAVAALLRSSKRVVGLTALAHLDRDNRYLQESVVRQVDESWIHNVDAMVEAAGGQVAYRLWQPPADATDRGHYLILATPNS